MASNFTSKLGPSLKDYLNFKRARGYKYISGERLLKNLDCFLAANYPDADTISKEIVYRWGLPESLNVKPQTINKRLALLTELGNFLKLSNKATFVLSRKERLALDKSFVCRILSEDEVIKLFAKADGYSGGKIYSGLTISVILRLLYSTGVRPGEVFRLKLDDFNYTTHELIIKESKGLCSRRIVVSSEIAFIINRYLELTAAPANDSMQLYLFTNNGDRTRPISTSWLSYIIKTLCREAELRAPLPRPYDFRHTFITTRILKWIQDGEDLNIMMPFLKVFVGHSSINDTWYYFKLIPKQVDMVCEITQNSPDLIPEVEESLYEW